jgi:hypothetical protein
MPSHSDWSSDVCSSDLAWEYVGFGIVALFIVAWAVAMLIYRWKGYESQGLGPRAPPGPPPPRGGTHPTSDP